MNSIDNNYQELLELVNQELEDMTLEDLKNFYFDRRVDEITSGKEQYYQLNREIQAGTFEKDSKE